MNLFFAALLLAASAPCAAASVEGAFLLASENVGRFRGQALPLPDIEQPRPLDQLVERWRFDRCVHLVSDATGKLSVEDNSAYPAPDEMTVHRSVMGNPDGRAVTFATRNLDFLASLESDAPAARAGGVRTWEGLTRVEGGAGRANGAGGRPGWMSYSEENRASGPRATITLQTYRPAEPGSPEMLLLERYDSDGGMMQIIAGRLPNGQVRYKAARGCGSGFGVPVDNRSRDYAGELGPLRFNELEARTRAFLR